MKCAFIAWEDMMEAMALTTFIRMNPRNDSGLCVVVIVVGGHLLYC